MIFDHSSQPLLHEEQKKKHVSLWKFPMIVAICLLVGVLHHSNQYTPSSEEAVGIFGLRRWAKRLVNRVKGGNLVANPQARPFEEDAVEGGMADFYEQPDKAQCPAPVDADQNSMTILESDQSASGWKFFSLSPKEKLYNFISNGQDLGVRFLKNLHSAGGKIGRALSRVRESIGNYWDKNPKQWAAVKIALKTGAKITLAVALFGATTALTGGMGPAALLLFAILRMAIGAAGGLAINCIAGDGGCPKFVSKYFKRETWSMKKDVKEELSGAGFDEQLGIFSNGATAAGAHLAGVGTPNTDIDWTKFEINAGGPNVDANGAVIEGSPADNWERLFDNTIDSEAIENTDIATAIMGGAFPEATVIPLIIGVLKELFTGAVTYKKDLEALKAKEEWEKEQKLIEEQSAAWQAALDGLGIGDIKGVFSFPVKDESWNPNIEAGELEKKATIEKKAIEALLRWPHVYGQPDYLHDSIQRFVDGKFGITVDDQADSPWIDFPKPDGALSWNPGNPVLWHRRTGPPYSEDNEVTEMKATGCMSWVMYPPQLGEWLELFYKKHIEGKGAEALYFECFPVSYRYDPLPREPLPEEWDSYFNGHGGVISPPTGMDQELKTKLDALKDVKERPTSKNSYYELYFANAKYHGKKRAETSVAFAGKEIKTPDVEEFARRRALAGLN